MKKSAFLASAAGAILCCTLIASAQTIPAAQSSSSDAQNAVTSYFTEDSVGDVQLGRLGLQKSSNAKVRVLARAMVTDHTMTARAGWRVAHQTGNDEVKFKPGDDNTILLSYLSTFTGAQFDKQYIQALIKAHEKDIETVNNALTFVRNAQIRAYLQTSLRIDRKHLAMAQSIRM